MSKIKSISQIFLNAESIFSCGKQAASKQPCSSPSFNYSLLGRLCGNSKILGKVNIKATLRNCQEFSTNFLHPLLLVLEEKTFKCTVECVHILYKRLILSRYLMTSSISWQFLATSHLYQRDTVNCHVYLTFYFGINSRSFCNHHKISLAISTALPIMTCITKHVLSFRTCVYLNIKNNV